MDYKLIFRHHPVATQLYNKHFRGRDRTFIYRIAKWLDLIDKLDLGPHE